MKYLSTFWVIFCATIDQGHTLPRHAVLIIVVNLNCLKGLKGEIHFETSFVEGLPQWPAEQGGVPQYVHTFLSRWKSERFLRPPIPHLRSG